MTESLPTGGGEEPPPLVARVAVDVNLAHLDRLFDYLVPEALAEAAVPGCRVRVRFAGRLVDGWLIEYGTPEPGVRPAELKAVLSGEPLVTPELFALIRRVADHQAGTWSDVARLAIPPRHATTEKADQRPWPEPRRPDAPTVLPGFPAGEAFLAALAAGGSPRAFWQVPPVQGGAGDLVGGVIEAVAATLASGRSAVVVVPTRRELTMASSRLRQAFGAAAVATLSAELGRSARYRNYLACARGEARVVVGTRSAAFAPVTDLGLVVVVDDGHDQLAEPRAPYPHARTVAVLRQLLTGCGLLLASHARSAEAHDLVERDWLRPIQLSPAATRRISPPVRIAGDDPGREPTAARLRLPSAAFRLLRDRLPEGPVLVQVPLRGQFAVVACTRCDNVARCPRCRAPLRMPGPGVVACSFCAHRPPRWECAFCHSTTYRTGVAGAGRTAEELARAFPGVLAVNSSADGVKLEVPAVPAIVVATPGAEPAVPGGYAGVLLLDTGIMLSRPDLRVEEEAFRRWSNAIALSRPPEQGGTVLAVGESGQPALQALVRADAPGFLSQVLADRRDAGLPPAVKIVRVGGDPEAVADFLDNDPFEGVDVLGPSEVRGHPVHEVQALLRVPLDRGRDLVAKVRAASAIRSARKEGGRLYIQVDPEVME